MKKYVLITILILIFSLFITECSLTHKYYYQNTAEKYSKEIEYLYGDYNVKSESKNIETDNLESDYSIMYVYYKKYTISNNKCTHIYDNTDSFYTQVINNVADYMRNKFNEEGIQFCVSKELNEESTFDDFKKVYGHINLYKDDLSCFFKDSQCYLEISECKNKCYDILKVFPDANVVYEDGDQLICYRERILIDNVESIEEYINDLV